MCMRVASAGPASMLNTPQGTMVRVQITDRCMYRYAQTGFRRIYLTSASAGPLRAGGRRWTRTALVAALHSGHVRAALDVTDPEPLPPGHPLWKVPTCF